MFTQRAIGNLVSFFYVNIYACEQIEEKFLIIEQRLAVWDKGILFLVWL